MEQDMETPSVRAGKVKLSREELLAGKCLPDPQPILDFDPRLKNPDVLLERLAIQSSSIVQKKTREPFLVESTQISPPQFESFPESQILPTEKLHPLIERFTRSTMEEIPTNGSAVSKPADPVAPKPIEIDVSTWSEKSPVEDPVSPNSQGQKELKELKDRFEQEKRLWMDYDRQMRDWKKEVIEIVQNLKKETAGKQELEIEVKVLKAQLQSKDEELLKLQTRLKNPEPTTPLPLPPPPDGTKFIPL